MTRSLSLVFQVCPSLPCLSLSSLSSPLYLSPNPQCEGRPGEGSLTQQKLLAVCSFISPASLLFFGRVLVSLHRLYLGLTVGRVWTEGRLMETGVVSGFEGNIWGTGQQDLTHPGQSSITEPDPICGGRGALYPPLQTHFIDCCVRGHIIPSPHWTLIDRPFSCVVSLQDDIYAVDAWAHADCPVNGYFTDGIYSASPLSSVQHSLIT